MTLALALGLLLLCDQNPDIRREAKLAGDLGPGLRLAALERLRHDTGLEVLVLTRPLVRGDQCYFVHATPPAESLVSTILPVLEAELRLYPPSFFRAIGLRRVVLCADLAYRHYGQDQRAGGLACAADDLVYVSVEDLAEGREYALRGRLHHEIFHVLDLRTPRPPAGDLEWSGLNATGVFYVGPKPPSHGQLNDTGTGPAPEGFASRYAMTDEGEDKAETFAHLVAIPWSMQTRGEDDPVLARKARCLKARVVRVCRAMDEGFWAANDARPRTRFAFRLVVTDIEAALSAALSSRTNGPTESAAPSAETPQREAGATAALGPAGRPAVALGPEGELASAAALVGGFVIVFLAAAFWGARRGRRRGPGFSASCPALDFRVHRSCAISASGFWIMADTK